MKKYTKDISEYSYEEARELLIKLIKEVDESKIKFNPTPIEWNNNFILFGLAKHYGRLLICL